MSDINDDTINSTLYDELGNPVNVVNESGIYRLAVTGNVSISGDESPTKYQLRWDIDPVGDTVTSTDTLLFTFTGIGICDFVAIAAGNSTYEAIVKVDGIEQFRASMSDLGSVGLTNAVNVPVWAENANKLFRLRPLNGFGFSNSFSVWARATGTSLSNVTHAVMYREKI